MASFSVWMGILRPRSSRRKGGHRSNAIPELTLHSTIQRLDAEKLERYRFICGSAEYSSSERTDDLPPCYFQHLAGNLHMELLANPEFPVSPLGLVHIGNEIDQTRPIRQDELPVALTVSLSDGGGHPRGRLVRIETIARPPKPTDAGLPPPWRSVITALLPIHRAPGADRLKTPTSSTRSDAIVVPGGAGAMDRAEWTLAANLGRRFSFLMGDFNPIHLWPWSARLFGFRRPIIHGMWTLGRSLSAIEASLPGFPRRIEVEFKRPLFLPSTAQFSWGCAPSATGKGAVYFSVTPSGSEKAAVAGRISPLKI